MCDGKGEQSETYPPVDEEQRVGVGSTEELEYQDQEHKKMTLSIQLKCD